MENQQNQNENSLLAGQEPHQKEEIDQATAASAASFTLEPDKGLTPDPDKYNKGAAQGNIKQTEPTGHDEPASLGSAGFDSVSSVDLDADENSITEEDLQALGGADENSDDEESTMS